MVEELLAKVDLSPYKGILWDLDNTFYAYDPVHKLAYSVCSDRAESFYGIEKSDFDSNWKIARERVHQDLHSQGASHSRLLYFQKVHEQIFACTNADFTLEMEALYWNTFMDHMQWRPGIEAFLLKAKNEGMRMALVTDLTAAVQLKKWQKLGLEKYLDFMVSSEEAGIEKPAAYIFQLALEKLKLDASEVVMFGDSVSKDIKGAEAIGIKSYLIS